MSKQLQVSGKMSHNVVSGGKQLLEELAGENQCLKEKKQGRNNSN